MAEVAPQSPPHTTELKQIQHTTTQVRTLLKNIQAVIPDLNTEVAEYSTMLR